MKKKSNEYDYEDEDRLEEEQEEVAQTSKMTVNRVF
jgi:hypothetical protein